MKLLIITTLARLLRPSNRGHVRGLHRSWLTPGCLGATDRRVGAATPRRRGVDLIEGVIRPVGALMRLPILFHRAIVATGPITRNVPVLAFFLRSQADFINIVFEN